MNTEPESPIRRTRQEAALSQIELALRTRPRLSLSTIRLAERGIHTTRTLNLLARALGVSVDALLGRGATS